MKSRIDTGDAVDLCLPDGIDILYGDYDGTISGYAAIIFRRKRGARRLAEDITTDGSGRRDSVYIPCERNRICPF